MSDIAIFITGLACFFLAVGALGRWWLGDLVLAIIVAAVLILIWIIWKGFVKNYRPKP